MSRTRFTLVLAIAAAAISTMSGFTRKFAKVQRTQVISCLSTYARVESAEWATARAERAGVTV